LAETIGEKVNDGEALLLSMG